MLCLSCVSYNNGDNIPIKHAFKSVVGGQNISPGFSWSNPPINTKSFCLSIVDPHPVAKNWLHWLVINIPFQERKIVEGASRTNSLPQGAKEMMNSFNELGYGGPAPPKGSGKHPYVATLYALNVDTLNLGVNTLLREFERLIDGKVIEQAELTGYYER